MCDVCAAGCPFTSVQAAIDAASAGATVTVCPGTYQATLNIRKNLQLVGAGDGARGTILQGSGAAPVVEIPRGVTVTLRKLRITGGRDRQGEAGGVWSQGATTIVDCTITGNHSRNAGGGVSNYQGTLTLTNCLVTGNSAEYRGGGIATREGTLIVTNSAITGNAATFTSSDPGGGGIHSYGSTVELTDCTIGDNTALVIGGGIFSELSTVSLTDCAVSANTVTYEGFGVSTGSRGGGITSDNGSLILSRCLVNDNFAHEGGGIFSKHDDDRGLLRLIESEIRGNQAERLSGGGIRAVRTTVELTKSVVRQNSACCYEGNPNTAGGGLSVAFGGVTFDEESRVMENTSAGPGGGISNFRGVITLFAPDNVVANSPNNCAGDPVAQCEN